MYEDHRINNTCWIIIVLFVLFILAISTVFLLGWDSFISPSGPVFPIPSDTMDKFTLSQYLSAQPSSSNAKTVRSTDESIVGNERQLFLAPPEDKPSSLLVNNKTLRYEYSGTKSNGFETRWLDYITDTTDAFPIIDLSDVDHFAIDISSLKLNPSNASFTLQMNVKDASGVESSVVVEKIETPETIVIDTRSFIGNDPGKRPDFGSITGVWLGGDFKDGGGNVVLGPLMFVRN